MRHLVLQSPAALGRHIGQLEQTGNHRMNFAESTPMATRAVRVRWALVCDAGN
jgi:hypothetical protein